MESLRMAYTFELTLLDSSDPIITRVFDVPAWFSFRQLHYTIQYAMGPWQLTHLHNFTFERLPEDARGRLSSRVEVLEISPSSEFEGGFGMPPQRQIPKVAEEDLKLSDVFDPSGRLNSIVVENGTVLPLVYVYDFGVRLENAFP